MFGSREGWGDINRTQLTVCCFKMLSFTHFVILLGLFAFIVRPVMIMIVHTFLDFWLRFMIKLPVIMTR